jgi:signal transduction histidine kinase
VDVRLSVRDGRLRFEVHDDGGGFDPTKTGYGTGLQGIADRLGALEGALEVSSEPGGGTAVAGEVPVPKANAVTAARSTDDSAPVPSEAVESETPDRSPERIR